MLRIREAVVVEGKHDRIRLQQVVDAPIIVTNGFRIFKDQEQVALLRRLAATRGLVLFTDSDAAGFVIRQHLCGVIPPERLKHAYCPVLPGKERRKSAPSKEGLLGVEGIDPEALAAALRRAGVTILEEDAPPPAPWLTRARAYEDGLIGGVGSAARRQTLLRRMGLPPYLSTNRLIEALNLTATEEEYARWIREE